MSYGVAHAVTSKGSPVMHEVASVTGNGNFITACQNMFQPARAVEFRSDDGPKFVVDCTDCKASHLPPVAKPEPLQSVPRRVHKRQSSGRPQWRVSKTATQNAGENIRYALTNVIACAEWYNRGAEGQFRENMLDQAWQAYRFLGELLTSHGRDTNPPDLDDDIPE